MSRFYDYIVIGSGAGGGVTAYYLSKAGANVLLIESGKAYQADTYPNNELDANAQLLWGGGTELTKDAKTVILRGKVLGGGTIVNQALLDRFDEVAWRDFKAQSAVSFFDVDSMAGHYDAIENEIPLHKFTPEDWNGNAKLYTQAFDKLGYEWGPLRRGQSRCNHDNDCIVCLGGCTRDSKQSTAINFIKKACEQYGLTVVTQCHVENMYDGSDFVTVSATHQGRSVQFFGKQCVIAAGAIGSTALLLKNQLAKTLPALGKNFYCHPQFMSIGLMDDIVDSHKGALQSVKSTDPRFRDWRFKLENVFAGPVAVALLKKDYSQAHQAFMQKYRNMACIEVALRDAMPGCIKLAKNGRLVVDKPLSDSDKANAKRGIDLVRDLLAAAGAKEILSSDIQIGLHLMGGCVMGQSAADAVVAEDFSVFGAKNLYVVDGGVFPNAPGINPSLSIMALAHRAAQGLLAQAGQQIGTGR